MSETPTNNTEQPPGELVRPAATFYQLHVKPEEQGDVFADPAAFAHWQRVAFTFARSSLVPAHLRGEQHIADILIALDMARRMKLNPLQVLQSLYVVSGNAGWYTTFLSALALNDGWDLDYEVREIGEPISYQRKTSGGGEKATIPNLGVRCLMTRDAKTKRGIEITSHQAIAARWANNEQWVHSTEHMLTNRATTFAIRRYAPGLLLGLKTQEELDDDRSEPSEATYEEPPGKTAFSRGLDAVRQAVASPSPASSTGGSAPPVQQAGGGGQATKTPTKKKQPCEKLHPTTGVRCTTFEPTHHRDESAGSHGYVPEGWNFRIWWMDDGTMGPTTPPVPADPGPQDPPLSDETEAKLQAAQEAKVPKINSVKEADMIEAALITKPRGAPVQFEIVKHALRKALGAKQLGDERVLSALRFGVGVGKWELVGEGDQTKVIPRGKGSPPPVAAEPGGAEPGSAGRAADAEANPLVNEWLGPHRDVWSPSDLEVIIGDTEEQLRGDWENVEPEFATLAKAAGIPVDQHGIHLEGAPAPWLRKYLAALRELDARLVAGVPT